MKRNAVNGEVPYSIMEEAISLMLSKGVSADEVYNFVMDCNILIGMDAQKMRDLIRSSEEKLHDLAYTEAQVYMQLNSGDAARSHMYFEQKSEELQKDIDYANEQLKN